MNKSARIVMFVFIALGVLGFLLATGFFARTSERALMNGATSLLPGLAGALGAYVGRTGTGKAIGLGILFALAALILLTVFFQVIWRML